MEKIEAQESFEIEAMDDEAVSPISGEHAVSALIWL